MGAFLAILGGVGSAAGQLMGGEAEEQAGKYNARLKRQRAKAVEQAMEMETGTLHDSARRKKAEQTAIAAKSGGQISSGTPLLVLAEQAGKMERDILEHRRGRMIEAQQLRSGAAMDEWQGKQAKRAAQFGAFSSLLGTATGF